MHVEKELENILLQILEQQKKQSAQIEKLSDRVDGISDRVEEVNDKAARALVILEADVKPKVQLLAEGFQGYAERVPLMDRMAENLETVKEDVSIIKDVVTSHSQELQDHDRVIKQLKAIQ